MASCFMDLEQQKKQLEEDIVCKKEELEALKSKALSDIEKKNEEERLNAEIKNFEEQLEKIKAELEKLKSDASNNWGVEVKNVPEVPVYSAEKLIEWTKLAEKMANPEAQEIPKEINKVIWKFLFQELPWVSDATRNNMSVGIQFAVMELMATQWANSEKVFEAVDTWLSDEWINAFFGKISKVIWSITNLTSKIFGPIAKVGAFGNIAKNIQNITTYMNANKDAFMKDNLVATDSVPELNNPDKFRKLLNTWEIVPDPKKIEASSRFTLNSAEGCKMTEEEEKELKAIANNEKLESALNEETLWSLKKALGSVDGFLDKRSGYQEMFASIFEMINKPLSMLGVHLLPSQIVWNGILGTALGVAALDLKYMPVKKATAPAKVVVTNAKQEPALTPEVGGEKENKEQLKLKIKAELANHNSPVTPDMVLATSEKFKVPVEYLMAFMKNDSHYGRDWLANKTHNPGNVWNDGKNTKDFWTREKWVDAVWDNLKKRIDAYFAKFGEEKYPKAFELAKWRKNWRWKFFGPYMIKPEWAASVETIFKELVQDWISNKDELLAN